MRQPGASQVIAPATLLDDLAVQLRLGEQWARNDPFALGTGLGSSDATPHAFGLYITDALYRKYGGTGAYETFAGQQLAYALGANPWGTSFIVGAGTTSRTACRARSRTWPGRCPAPETSRSERPSTARAARATFPGSARSAG